MEDINIFENIEPEYVTDITLGKGNDGDDNLNNKTNKNNNLNQQVNPNEDFDKLFKLKLEENERKLKLQSNTPPPAAITDDDILGNDSVETVASKNPGFGGFWGFLKKLADATILGTTEHSLLEAQKGQDIALAFAPKSRRDDNFYKKLQNARNTSEDALHKVLSGEVTADDLAPAFVKTAFNQTTLGLAYNIATGQPVYNLGDHKLSFLEDVAATALSFMMDAPLFAVGSGVGTVAGKAVARPIVQKSAAKLTEQLVTRYGLDKATAELVVKGGLNKLYPEVEKTYIFLNKASQAIPNITASGTALATYGALNDALQQQIEMGNGWNWGDVDYGKVMKKGLVDFTVGSTLGLMNFGGKAVERYIDNVGKAYENKYLPYLGKAIVKAGTPVAEVELFSDAANLLRDKDEQVSRLDALKMVLAGKLSSVVSKGLMLRDVDFKEGFEGKGKFSPQFNDYEKSVLDNFLQSRDYDVDLNGRIPDNVLREVVSDKDIPWILKSKLLYSQKGIAPVREPMITKVNMDEDENGIFIKVYGGNNNNEILLDVKKYNTSEKELAERDFFILNKEVQDNSNKINLLNLTETDNRELKLKYENDLIDFMKSNGIQISKLKDIWEINPFYRTEDQDGYLHNAISKIKEFKDAWLKENNISKEEDTRSAYEKFQEKLDEEIKGRRTQQEEGFIRPVMNLRPETEKVLNDLENSLNQINTDEITPDTKLPHPEGEIRFALNDLYDKYQLWTAMRDHPGRQFTREEIDGITSLLKEKIDFLEDVYYNKYLNTEPLDITLRKRFEKEQQYEEKLNQGLQSIPEFDVPEGALRITDYVRKKSNLPEGSAIPDDVNNIYVTSEKTLGDLVSNHLDVINKILNLGGKIAEYSKGETLEKAKEITTSKMSYTKLFNKLKYDIYNELLKDTNYNRALSASLADLATSEIRDNIESYGMYENPLKFGEAAITIPKFRSLSSENGYVKVVKKGDGTYDLKANYLAKKRFAENNNYSGSDNIKTIDDLNKLRLEIDKDEEIYKKIQLEKLKEVAKDEPIEPGTEVIRSTVDVEEGKDVIKEVHPHFVDVTSVVPLDEFIQLPEVNDVYEKFKNSSKEAEEASKKYLRVTEPVNPNISALFINDIESGKYNPEKVKSNEVYLSNRLTLKDLYDRVNIYVENYNKDVKEGASKNKQTRDLNKLYEAVRSNLKREKWTDKALDSYTKRVVDDILDRVNNKDKYLDDITKVRKLEEAKVNTLDKNNYYTPNKELHPDLLQVGKSLTVGDIYKDHKEYFDYLVNNKDQENTKNYKNRYTRLTNLIKNKLINDGISLSDASHISPAVIKDIINRLENPGEYKAGFESELGYSENIYKGILEKNKNELYEKVKESLNKIGLNEKYGYTNEYIETKAKAITDYLIDVFEHPDDYKYKVDSPLRDMDKIFMGDVELKNADELIDILKRWDKRYDIPSLYINWTDKNLVNRIEEALKYNSENPMTYEEMLRFNDLEKIESVLDQINDIRRFSEYIEKDMLEKEGDPFSSIARNILDKWKTTDYSKSIFNKLRDAAVKGYQLSNEDKKGLLTHIQEFFDKNKEFIKDLKLNNKVYNSIIRKINSIDISSKDAWIDVQNVLNDFEKILTDRAYARVREKEEELKSQILDMVNPKKFVITTERGTPVMKSKYKSGNVSADFVEKTIKNIYETLNKSPQEIQEEIELLQQKASKSQEDLILNGVKEGIDFDGYSFDDYQRLLFLNKYGSIDYKNLNQLVDIRNDIVNVLQTGKLALQQGHEGRRMHRETLIEFVKREITPKDKEGQPIPVDYLQPNVKIKSGTLKTWDLTFPGLLNLMSKYSLYEKGKGGKIYSDKLNEAFGRVNESALREQWERKDYREKLHKFITKEVLNSNNPVKVRNKILEWHVVHDNAITVLDVKGNRVPIAINKAQALNIWLIAQQEGSKAALEKPIIYDINGNRIDGMGFDEDAMKQLNEFIGEDLKKVGIYMRDIMRQYVDKRVNPVFRNLNGVNLDKVENYWPFYRVKGDVDIINVEDLLKNVDFFKLRLTSDHHISRTRSSLPFNMDISAFDIFHKYMDDQIRYTNWAEHMDNLSVFDNAHVRNLIKRFHGEQVLYDLDYFRRKFAGKENMERDYFIDKLIGTMNKGILYFSRRVGINQIAGTMSYMAVLRPDKLFSNMAYVMLTPEGRHIRNLIRHTDLYRTRGAAPFDIDLAMSDVKDYVTRPDWTTKELATKSRKRYNIDKAANYFEYAKNKGEDILSANVKYGDKFPIMFGGGAYLLELLKQDKVDINKEYDKALKESKTTGENPYDIMVRNLNKYIHEYTIVSENTQQSVTTVATSRIRGNKGVRVLTGFTAGAMSVERAALSCLRDSYRYYKQGNYKDSLRSFRSFFILHGVNGMVYSIISRGFRLDPEDLGISALLGNLEAVALLGKPLTIAKNIVLSEDYMNDWHSYVNVISPYLGAASSMVESVVNLIEAIKKYNVLSAENWAYKVAENVTRLVGIPVRQINQLAGDIKSIIEDGGEEVGVVRKALGYSDLEIGVPVEEVLDRSSWQQYWEDASDRRYINEMYGKINKIERRYRYSPSQTFGGD